MKRTDIVRLNHEGSQFLEPLFEYPEPATVAVRRLPQAAHPALRRPPADRQRHGLLVYYGGNLPTTPYTTNRDGRGPAWSNSLFEDNAEFGLGFRLWLWTPNASRAHARRAAGAQIGDNLVTSARR